MNTIKNTLAFLDEYAGPAVCLLAVLGMTWLAVGGLVIALIR